MRNQKGFTIILAIVAVAIILSLGGRIYLSSKTESLDTPASSPAPTNNLKPQIFIIKGRSMLPNYSKDQIWLYKKYTKEQPKRFDIIIFENPVATDFIINKRIIGTYPNYFYHIL